MPEEIRTNQSISAFILLKGNSHLRFLRFIREVENDNGLIRHAFPPKILFAMVSENKVRLLAGNSLVEFITTEEVDDSTAVLFPAKIQDIITVWNSQINEIRKVLKSKTDADLSWDAPGHLPPDPPPKLRKMMKDWEKDMGKIQD